MFLQEAEDILLSIDLSLLPFETDLAWAFGKNEIAVGFSIKVKSRDTKDQWIRISMTQRYMLDVEPDFLIRGIFHTIQELIFHEIQECFLVKGVRIFDPHT